MIVIELFLDFKFSKFVQFENLIIYNYKYHEK